MLSAGYGPLLMLLVTSPRYSNCTLLQGMRFQQLTHLTGQLGLNFREHQDDIYVINHIDFNSPFRIMLLAQS